MKYDLLKKYKDYLEKMYSHETARTYAIRLECLFEGQSLTNIISQLDIPKVISKLSEIKYKNHFSQSKNAFLHFCKFQNIVLDYEHLNTINRLEKHTHKKYRNFQALNFDEVNNKIKHIKNQKLKLSFQTMLATGLRVFELSQITPNQCFVSADEICFYFLAKGGKTEKVTIYKEDDSKLFVNLLELIEKTKKDNKLFYSAIYLQINAKKLGFKCHDLRRAYAKIEYKKTKSKELVMEKLRHTSIKTTNIYLRSKIKI